MCTEQDISQLNNKLLSALWWTKYVMATHFSQLSISALSCYL